MKFKEVETKYDAEDISLQDFLDLTNTLNPVKWINVSSYDDYFVDNEDNFIRYRYTDDRGELTIKKKTTGKNNNNRIEVNVPTEGDIFGKVEAFANLLGYKHNFCIFKTCKIAFLEKVVLVYYVVYDKDLHEKRRFIEIEANEDYPWASEEAAWNEVLAYEVMFESIGIKHQNRLRKSMFEMFKKD